MHDQTKPVIRKPKTLTEWLVGERDICKTIAY